jgi:hypothetical protein
VTLYIGACIASLERIPAEVERLASDLIELSTRYNFAFWLPGANVLRGWARSATGDSLQNCQKRRRVRRTWIWEAHKTEEESPHRDDPSTKEDQDSCQNRAEIPRRQGSEGCDSRREEVSAVASYRSIPPVAL